MKFTYFSYLTMKLGKQKECFIINILTRNCTENESQDLAQGLFM